ncbi:SET domain-containing protein SmydA-8-like [Augochlora pura]
MDAPGSCCVCGKPAYTRCHECQNAFYCGKPHQRKDWRRHSQVCKPFKLVVDPVLGRHYVATRDIDSGEMIIKEAPLFSGTGWSPFPTCLGCSGILEKDSAVPCPKCAWPLCSVCTEHGPECYFISKRSTGKKSIADFSFESDTSQCMDVVKVLAMKSARPHVYKKFMMLQSHSDKEIIKDLSVKIEEDIRIMFAVDDVTSEEITKIMGILKINAYGVPSPEHTHLAVYELSAMIEHNCKANCSKRVGSDNRLYIRAEVAIKMGDHISVCYVNSLLGTEQRRHFLKTFYFFDCICVRCKDPTEFGVNINAIKCKTSNCSGYVLPKTFLVTDPLPYTCKTCNSSVSYEVVSDMLKNIGEEITRIKETGPSACGEFLERYSNILHSNHFYNIDVILYWVNNTSLEDLGSTNRSILCDWLKACKKLNILLRIISPADVDIRGSLLKFICTTLTMTHLQRNFGEAKDLLTEAQQLLKYN